MASVPTLRVGGVPEHFNYPWHLARERGLFAKHGVHVEWVEQKEGTGQMIKSVRFFIFRLLKYARCVRMENHCTLSQCKLT